MLWNRLRDRQLSGHKFRRQVRLGSFIVDFVCFEQRLVVEVDGGQHAERRHQINDHARTAWLNSQGYRVLRFWNNEILDNMEGTLAAVTKGLLDR